MVVDIGESGAVITEARQRKQRIAMAYIRTSSSEQGASSGQQRSDLAELAEVEGVGVSGWHEDLAVSGDSGPGERAGLAGLLEAARRGEFGVLLLWSVCRLLRTESLEGAGWLGVLRDAGIRIVTCHSGAFDLREPADRLRLLFLAENAHGENISRAHIVSRGLAATAKAGHGTGGPTKYGLDRVEMTPAGDVVQRLGPGMQKSTKSNHVSYVPGDADRVAAIKYMFDRFASSSISLRGLAHELTAKGYPSPHAGIPWQGQAVQGILSNPCYTGASRYAMKAAGKYYAIGPNGTERRPRKAGLVVNESPILVAGMFEGIVSKRVFDKAQKRLRKIKTTRRANSRVGHPLSGLLRCGHCGAIMYIRRRGTPHFTCSRYVQGGKRSGCNYNSVAASDIEDWVSHSLLEHLRNSKVSGWLQGVGDIDRHVIRGVYQEAIERIDFTWRHERRGRSRIRSVLEGAAMLLRNGSVIRATDSRLGQGSGNGADAVGREDVEADRPGTGGRAAMPQGQCRQPCLPGME